MSLLSALTFGVSRVLDFYTIFKTEYFSNLDLIKAEIFDSVFTKFIVDSAQNDGKVLSKKKQKRDLSSQEMKQASCMRVRYLTKETSWGLMKIKLKF